MGDGVCRGSVILKSFALFTSWSLCINDGGGEAPASISNTPVSSGAVSSSDKPATGVSDSSVYLT